MPELIINGPAGRIEARYHHEPADDSPIALILHPHPQFGGTMNNQVVYSLYYTFVRARLFGAAVQFPRRRPQPGLLGRRPGRAVRTPPPRSTGCRSSSPTPSSCWIAGVSFGTWIAMQLLMRRPEVDGFICVAPPSNLYDFSFLAPCPSSGLMVNGDKDRVVPSNSVGRADRQAQDAARHQDRPRDHPGRQPLLRGQDRASCSRSSAATSICASPRPSRTARARKSATRNVSASAKESVSANARWKPSPSSTTAATTTSRKGRPRDRTAIAWNNRCA